MEGQCAIEAGWVGQLWGRSGGGDHKSLRPFEAKIPGDPYRIDKQCQDIKVKHQALRSKVHLHVSYGELHCARPN